VFLDRILRTPRRYADETLPRIQSSYSTTCHPSDGGGNSDCAPTGQQSIFTCILVFIPGTDMFSRWCPHAVCGLRVSNLPPPGRRRQRRLRAGFGSARFLVSVMPLDRILRTPRRYADETLPQIQSSFSTTCPPSDGGGNSDCAPTASGQQGFLFRIGR